MDLGNKGGGYFQLARFAAAILLVSKRCRTYASISDVVASLLDALRSIKIL